MAKFDTRKLTKVFKFCKMPKAQADKIKRHNTAGTLTDGDKRQIASCLRKYKQHELNSHMAKDQNQKTLSALYPSGHKAPAKTCGTCKHFKNNACQDTALKISRAPNSSACGHYVKKSGKAPEKPTKAKQCPKAAKTPDKKTKATSKKQAGQKPKGKGKSCTGSVHVKGYTVKGHVRKCPTRKGAKK